MKTKNVDIIKQYESCELEAYKCPANVWTIGYGHTKGVTEGMAITEEEAEKLLQEDLEVVENYIDTLVYHLTQNQYDALVSFMFNVGIGNFSKSTMKKYLDSGDMLMASEEFDKWVFCKGQVLGGLIARREDEKSLFLKEDTHTV